MSYLLVQNTDVQKKLREEILETIKKCNNDINKLTYDDISKMVYMTNTIKETLRHYSIIPFISRVTTCEISCKNENNASDIIIPANTNILIPLYWINRDEKTWNESSKFNPDRFNELSDTTLKSKGYIPFGDGSRSCIGKYFANYEIAIFFCHILSKYELIKDDNFKPKISSGISLTTSNGINIIFKKLQ